MKLRGYDIELFEDEWIYSDTKKSTSENWVKIPCGYCGMNFTKEGHDGCLGVLPKIMNACCGHGVNREAYIQYNDGSCIRGREAINKFKEINTLNNVT